MRAAVGDKLVIRGHAVGQPEKHATIVEVRGPDGEPPFVIHWDDDPPDPALDHLFFPGPDADVEHVAGEAASDRSDGASRLKAMLVCASTSHGNTWKVAERMASVLDARVVAPDEAEVAALERCELVGFGSGIYRMSVHPELRELVDAMPPMLGRRAFLFSTHGAPIQLGGWLSPLRAMESALRSKGLEIVGQFDCKGFDTYGPLGWIGGLNKGHPDEHDLDEAERFAMRVRERVQRSLLQG